MSAGRARQTRGGGSAGTGFRLGSSPDANGTGPAAVRGVDGARVGSSVPGSGTPGTTRAPSLPHEGAQSRASDASTPALASAAAAGVASGLALGHVAVLPHPVACMGQEAVPQQDFAGAGACSEPAACTEVTACPLPSTAAHTGVSVKRPGASAARTRRAKPKARIERITPPSYTIEKPPWPER